MSLAVVDSDRARTGLRDWKWQWMGLIGFIVMALAAEAIGGWLTARSVGTWYEGLIKPSWNPPGWVFGPVWTTLYLLMAVAAWLVWRRDGWGGARAALNCYVVQLVLNVAWSGLFFGLRNPPAGFTDIIFLWMAIAVTLVLFWRRSVWAGVLMTPYLAWVTFAAGLNLELWLRNV